MRLRGRSQERSPGITVRNDRSPEPHATTDDFACSRCPIGNCPAAQGHDEPPLSGGLPLDVGIVVLKVGTAAAIARAVLRGEPLTHRIVRASGAGVREPKNLLVPIVAGYRELIDYAGGLTDDAARCRSAAPVLARVASPCSEALSVPA